MVRLILLATLVASTLATTTSSTTAAYQAQPSCAAPPNNKNQQCVPIPPEKKAKDANGCTNANKDEQASFCPFEVQVGDQNKALKYFPEEPDEFLCPGRKVIFKFNPANHTVTESSFAEPCKPLAANLTRPDRPGIRTGFVPVTGNEPFIRTFTVQINDTKPIWLFCGQKTPKSHCKAGMVMAINVNKADASKSLQLYKDGAAKVPDEAAPSPPAGGSSSTTTTTSAAGAITPGPSSSTTTDSVGPILATSSTTRVSIFTGAAVPTAAPRRYIAAGGLAVVGAVALL